MMATVRTTVMPDFSVDVFPLYEEELTAQQRYSLALRDGTGGTLELVFPSPQDLRAFLTWTREAFAGARQEARVRRGRIRWPRPLTYQASLF